MWALGWGEAPRKGTPAVSYDGSNLLMAHDAMDQFAILHICTYNGTYYTLAHTPCHSMLVPCQVKSTKTVQRYFVIYGSAVESCVYVAERLQ